VCRQRRKQDQCFNCVEWHPMYRNERPELHLDKL
jgi:hypothetical protein